VTILNSFPQPLRVNTLRSEVGSGVRLECGMFLIE
jgi:hypothetical protein